jgi:hypothetical protein
MRQLLHRASQAHHRPGRVVMRAAAAAVPLALAALAVTGGPAAAPAYAAGQAAPGCTGITQAHIPAQGVITNPAGTEGGHLWWRAAGGGTCVGTVIEDVQATTATPALTLRVIVYDQADPGGLTVARQQVTVAPGPVTRAFGIHRVFAGLTAVCLAATSPVTPSPDMPCAGFGQPAPPQQFTQPGGPLPFAWQPEGWPQQLSRWP